MPAKLVRVVLDVLKPRELDTAELARAICELEGVSQAMADVVEVDVRTETIKFTVEGDELNLKLVLKELEERGCAVRSVDSIVVKRY